MWWIEHGPLTGGKLGQDAWDQTGRETRDDALKHIKFLLDMGAIVHALNAPGGDTQMDEAQITKQLGPPKGNKF